MAELEIHQFNCRQDNFGVLIHDEETGVTAAIDAPEEEAVLGALSEKGWKLTHILLTHHHQDHVEGVSALKSRFDCKVFGAEKDSHRLQDVDSFVNEGDEIEVGGHRAKVIETPGHTTGHVTYWFEDASVAFVGDTLFSMGCGRLFECPPDVMWRSLSKVMELPPETKIYCGHEYTLSNADFALTIEPENAALQKRAREVRELREKGLPTLPTTLALELETNPFLRVNSANIRSNLAMESDPDDRVFAEVRARKDRA